MTTLLAFLVTLGILIIIHEYGHYAAARANGVKVLRFSVGFGPVIARRLDRRGTEWALSALPLGGYVKMVDEREGPVAEADLPHAFNRQPVWRRMIIVAAGPLANFLLAIALYWGLYAYGVPVLRPLIAQPAADTAAARAGLGEGALITRINDETVEDWQGLHWLLLKHGVDTPRLKIDGLDREGRERTYQLNLGDLDLLESEGNPLPRLGLTPYEPPIAPIIGALQDDSPGQRAGLRPGDRVVSLDDRPVTSWSGLVAEIRARPERELRLEIVRQGEHLQLRVTPRAETAGGETIGRIGASPHVPPGVLDDLRAEVRFGPIESFRRALHKTWDLSVFSLEMLGRMLMGEASLKNLSGPITIADYAGRSAEAGLVAFIGFLALISVSLGVLNLLPIPLLDGGHLLYYLAEFFTGRPVPDAVQELGQRIGAALLAALMFFAIFNDFQRLISG